MLGASVWSLIIVVLLLGAAKNVAAESEIGIPYPKSSPTKQCFGATLSGTGKHFYTLREGVLTKYRINSFAAQGAIKIAATVSKELRNKNCRILLTENQAKLIIVSQKRIFVLDATSGELSQKFEANWQILFVGAVINNTELVVLGLSSDGSNRLFDLFIFDIEDISKWKREIPDLGMRFRFSPDMHSTGMEKVRDRIYFTTTESMLVLNSKNYAPELSVKFKAFSRYPFSAPRISKDAKELVIPGVASLKDFIATTDTEFGSAKANSVLVFSQASREFKFKQPEDVAPAELAPVLALTSPVSRAGDYLLISKGPSNALAFLVNLRTDTVFNFHQYDSGETVVMVRPLGGTYTAVQVTPEARRYLMMKKSDGQVVPMNDETFEKFHKE